MNRRNSSNGADGGAGNAGQYSSNRNYVPKTQKKFVPKQQSPHPNTSTLSDSLRRSSSSSSSSAQSDAAAPSSSSGAASSSRVRMGDSGEWVSNRAGVGSQTGRFVNYLPQDEAVAAGLGADKGGLDAVESQRVVDLLNRELSRLLKLSPRLFWKEVASDVSLHEFLDSFLKFRSRWYDFPYRGAKEIVAGVIVGDLELCRRVFMVLYRISSNRDPGARAADSLSLNDHSVLLQEKKLLDLPKLLDICAIYGHENEELTGVLVKNALNSQPGIHYNLTAVMSHFLGIVHTMYQRCTSSMEVLFSSTSPAVGGFSQLRNDFLEVMDFINDAIVSMDALVAAYNPAALFFSLPVLMSDEYGELLSVLARLHDSLIPSFQRGFRMMFSQQGDAGMISSVAISLKMLSLRIATFGWKILDFCYLSNELFKDTSSLPEITKMFPANVEDPMIRAEILIQTFRDINGISLSTPENHNNTFLKSIDQNFHLMGRLNSLQNTGWIFLDDENLQYLSGIMMSPPKKSSVTDPPVLPPSSLQPSKLVMDEDAAFVESKISQIKDLFPDYGNGFLAACLDVYNQNPEEVVQRILEGTLHEDLQRLDVSLATKPASKSDSTVSSKDKGKAKLDETSPLPPLQPHHHSSKPVQAVVHKTGGSSGSSLSATGRFVRKSGTPDRNILDTRDDADIARNAALVSQYEYDDEYDDSFDDLGLSVAETRVEDDESLNERIQFAGSGKHEPASSGRPPSEASKWGTKKKPQYYVKDGKNYSYKVEGAIAVANKDEAQILTQEQAGLIHGLGKGGNVPLSGSRKWRDEQQQEQEEQPDEPGTERREYVDRGFRGRVRRGAGNGMGGRSTEVQGEQQNGGTEGEGSENSGGFRGGRGRGRGGRGSGAGAGKADNHHRKDRAIRKHLAGL